MTQDSQKHLRISRTETCVVETVGIGVETLRNTYELVVLKLFGSALWALRTSALRNTYELVVLKHFWVVY